MAVNESSDAVVGTSAPSKAPALRRTLTDHLLRHPSLIVTLAYAITALVGVWGSYWYYSSLGVPILEFLQIGDFFVAGLRDPAYALFAVVALLSSWITNIPYGWRETQPERYARLRGHWWFRMSYVELPAWTGARRLPPGTGALIGVVWIMLWCVFTYAQSKAQKVREGGGTPIVLDATKIASDTRLLGTTSAWVFVWHISRVEAEALPIESISRIGLTVPAAVTPRVVPMPPAATPTPAADVAIPPAEAEKP